MKYATKVIVLNDSKLLKVTTPQKLFNEKGVDKYSLEIPTLYKFKHLLENNGFKKDLKSINDFDALIDAIVKEKNNG